jgi:hypothetical protein
LSRFRIRSVFGGASTQPACKYAGRKRGGLFGLQLSPKIILRSQYTQLSYLRSDTGHRQLGCWLLPRHAKPPRSSSCLSWAQKENIITRSVTPRWSFWTAERLSACRLPPHCSTLSEIIEGLRRAVRRALKFGRPLPTISIILPQGRRPQSGAGISAVDLNGFMTARPR